MMKPISALFSLLSQFAPIIITIMMAGASYWAALKADLSVFNMTGSKNPTQPDYYLNDLKVQSTDKATGRVMILTGARAEHIPQTNNWTVQEPKLIVKSNDGRLLDAQSKSAVYSPEVDHVQMQNEVLLKANSADGQTVIQTKSLNIDNQQSLLSTKDPIIATRTGQRFEAQGMEWREKEGQLKTLGAVKFFLEGQR